MARSSCHSEPSLARDGRAQAAELRDGPVATARDPGTFIAQADVLTPAGEVQHPSTDIPGRWRTRVADAWGIISRMMTPGAICSTAALKKPRPGRAKDLQIVGGPGWLPNAPARACLKQPIETS